MKNKKIILAIVLLILSELPQIAFAQLIDDASSNPSWFAKLVGMLIVLFIFIGLPLLGVVLFFALIYLIIKEIRDNKKVVDNLSESDKKSKSKKKVAIVVLTLIILILILFIKVYNDTMHIL